MFVNTKGRKIMSNKTYLSASAIKDFKACPIRYRNAHHYGIRPIVDTEAQRVGTNWHGIQEINGMKPGGECPNTLDHELQEPCPLCNNTGILPDDLMESVVRYLNQVYGEIPDSMDKEKLEIERIILLYSLSGYNWYYQNQKEEVIATEIQFEIPVVNPASGRALPNVVNRGKIDKLIRINGLIYVKEHKSTSRSVDPDSDLWNHLTLDTQTNNYVYATRKLKDLGQLKRYGIESNDIIAGVYFDAWHKPGIRPKKLSQADSKKFIEDGEYCGQKFDIKRIPEEGLFVNDKPADIEPGKKEGTFAIKETPEMFGARLLQDIVERSEFYFNCKELSKTDPDIERFEWELYNIYKTIRGMVKTGHWYSDESQCEATFKCSYIEQCYNNILIDRDHVPDGMELIFRKNEEKSDDN